LIAQEQVLACCHRPGCGARPQAGLGVGLRQAGQGCAARSPPAPTHVSRPAHRVRLPAADKPRVYARRLREGTLARKQQDVSSGQAGEHARVERLAPCQACRSSIVLTCVCERLSHCCQRQAKPMLPTHGTDASVREYQGIHKSSYTGIPLSVSQCRRVDGSVARTPPELDACWSAHSACRNAARERLRTGAACLAQLAGCTVLPRQPLRSFATCKGTSAWAGVRCTCAQLGTCLLVLITVSLGPHIQTWPSCMAPSQVGGLLQHLHAHAAHLALLMAEAIAVSHKNTARAQKAVTGRAWQGVATIVARTVL